MKHGLLGDAAYFDEVERRMKDLRSLDHEALASVIAGSCRLKASVVARDETEEGIRATLNLGHTFGHAIEKLAGSARGCTVRRSAAGLCSLRIFRVASGT